MMNIEDFRAFVRSLGDVEALYPTVEKPGNPALRLWRSLPLDGSVPRPVIEQSVRRAYQIILHKYAKP